MTAVFTSGAPWEAEDCPRAEAYEAEAHRCTRRAVSQAVPMWGRCVEQPPPPPAPEPHDVPAPWHTARCTHRRWPRPRAPRRPACPASGRGGRHCGRDRVRLPSERRAQERWLEGTLDQAALKHPNPGRTESLHRLNWAEYQNAIRDLLALEDDVSALLPADDMSHGFLAFVGVLERADQAVAAVARAIKEAR